ncbi:FecR family protein [Pedobacter arcticus]|uniref:FecR family protein n=1 Tax=Pedobacter arcticus TaxID=752140 RepID=UPI000304BB5B|nr:FecR family protein [Pedobacter arcticus]
MGKYSTKSDLVALIRKYNEGKASVEEKEFLDSYYNYFEKKGETLESFSEAEKKDMGSELEANILRSINSRKKQSSIIYTLYRPLVAASLLLAMSAATYFYYQANSSKKTSQEVVFKKTSLAPEKEKSAVLTLANGKKLLLEDVANGYVADDVGVTINKDSNGSLIYSVKNNSTPGQYGSASYNTISTPKGGQYQVNLPDGTKVWLNTESALKYPVPFDKTSRLVELTGEAFFEVAKSKHRPFIVKTADAEVKVLGTHFNISAYTNDAFMKTTLVEGSVAIKSGENNKILKPGYQAVVSNNLPNINIKPVDVEEALAWKNGYFVFNNEDIKTVMKIIARWYNIEVVYEGNIKNEVFVGTVSRFDSIEKLLKTIELTGGVHFNIENNSKTNVKQVIVAP